MMMPGLKPRSLNPAESRSTTGVLPVPPSDKLPTLTTGI